MGFLHRNAKERIDMAEVVRTHYDDVWRFCARQVGDQLAGDAAQETFLTAQRRQGAFQGRSALRTWLFGIALNHCRNLRRKQSRETPIDWLNSAPAPGDHGRAAVERERLRAALAALSPEHRDVVLLHEAEGFAYAEIAEMLGVPVGTVKSRIYHAFLRLRAELRDPEEDPR